MKPNINENRNGLARQLLLLTGVFVVAATVAGAGIYSESLREIMNSEQDSQALDRLVQARKFNMLIQELNSGKVAEARRFLNLALAGDLREAQKIGGTANPAAAAEIKFAVAEFMRFQKAHPEYYAAEPVGGVKSPGTVQLARHDVKP